MADDKNAENIRKTLEKHNQSHLLQFFQDLNEKQKQDLARQIEQLDLGQIDVWIEEIVKRHKSAEIPTSFAPPKSYKAQPFEPHQQQKYQEAEAIGQNAIKDGRVAALVVAGGQGTRLGFDGPKGNFPISPVRNKTLFEIFAATIAAASKKYNSRLPWYIMTSSLNHHQTVNIFKSNNYYDLGEKNILIFQQGTLPNFDFDGKILLADKDKIACSPDGHGGVIKALYKSGAVDDMKKRGIKYISYFQVDNPLTNIFDTLFIGLHILDDAQMSSKALPKEAPKQQVGNFCLLDGKVTVIEYSDLPDKLAEKTNDDGSLVFNLGSIAIHIINRTFIEKLNQKHFSLPLHKAVKKIPHIDKNGNRIKPKEPNGVKLETFIFDALPMASNSIILETDKEQEFAPLKNAQGLNNPDNVRKRMVARCAQWLESAGVPVPRNPDGSANATLEIAPSFALCKDDLKEKTNQIPKINPGDNLYLQ